MTVQAPSQGQATEAQPATGLVEPTNVEGQKAPSLVDLFPAAVSARDQPAATHLCNPGLTMAWLRHLYLQSPHDIDWNPVSQDM